LSSSRLSSFVTWRAAIRVVAPPKYDQKRELTTTRTSVKSDQIRGSGLK
jgi:hypothetical protein